MRFTHWGRSSWGHAFAIPPLRSVARRGRRLNCARLGAGVLVAAALAAPAQAASLTDWSLSPVSTEFDDWTAKLGGTASGALYDSGADGGLGRDGATGALLLAPRATRDFDNGWELGLHTAILARHDALSGDSYGDRVFEKAYVSLDTQYGRVEFGQNDGAAYQLSVTGPKPDPTAAIDDANLTFWRDPSTGKAFVNLFRIRTAEFASENFAKLTYVSPELYGLEFAASYTPRDVRGVLPFAESNAGLADRQSNLLEAATTYTDSFGPVSANLSAGAVLGHAADRAPGQEGLRDFSLGAQFDTGLAGAKLSLGGAFRQSNAYTFDIENAFAGGTTRAARIAASVTKGPWILGIEYANARANREAALPSLTETGYEPSLSYVANANLQLTLGWQGLHLTRSSGSFFNGEASIDLRALFLHAALHV